MNSAITLSAFRHSLADQDPPGRLGAPLTALWWAAKGDWEKAHTIAQDDDSADAAWVHAYLHRVEGDLGNARYWYARARRAAATGSFETEWEMLVAALLAATE